MREWDDQIYVHYYSLCSVEVVLQNRDLRQGAIKSTANMLQKNDRVLQWEYVKSGKESYVREISNQLYMVFIETSRKI